MKQQPKVEERVAFVDWIRVIACFMVMLVHASENFYGADNSGLAGNVSMLATEANRFWWLSTTAAWAERPCPSS